MSLRPAYARYTERLSPDAPAVDVELPQSRADVYDRLRTIDRLAHTDPVAWKAAARQATSTCWYTMALFLTGSQRIDPFTGRPEWDNDFHFNWFLECQHDGAGVIDKSAREHGKTSIRCYVGVTVEVVNDPEITVGIFSFQRDAAARTGARLKEEWASNAELKAIWDDVFYADPERESPSWSLEKGITVRRNIIGSTPTVGWYAIGELPTGSRFGLGILDDIETEKTVSTEEMRQQTRDRVHNAFNLAGRGCRWWVNGTHHDSRGIINELIKSGAWRIRCHKAEDDTRPAPDIAKIYDECGGMLPIRDKAGQSMPLPIAVRDIRLAGAPVYLHPLELAHKRLLMGNEMYYKHNMGDAHAGQERRLEKDWIRYYTASPVEQARGAFLYILVDPSKGQNDPTFARVEACRADGTISWVGGLRRKLAPSKFASAIHQLYSQWKYVGNIVQIRIEEFGQATWTYHLKSYFDLINEPMPPLICCARHNSSNRESEGRRREWAGLEPLYRMGRRLYPKDGLWVQDDQDRPFDLAKFYADEEYGEFPMPNTDDGLAADYLLVVDKGKNMGGKEVDLRLEFPEDEELEEERLLAKLRKRASPYDGYDTDDSWMEAGFH